MFSRTNNANRFRYRRKKSSNLGGYWIFIPFFQLKLGRYPKQKTAFGEGLNEMLSNIRWKNIKFYNIISLRKI